MADKTVSERLQPSLLDRLTDNDPTGLKETRETRVIDMGRLREIIQRDLSWLLNTDNMESLLGDPDDLPHVRRSVLNYGVAPNSGDFSTGRKAEDIRQAILQAVEIFEPRIVRGSAIVEMRGEEAEGQMYVAFDIRAEMWAQPMPLELYLRSKIDLTTGEVQMERSP